MRFVDIKASIVSLLSAAADGRFRVIGAPRATESAAGNSGNSRSVQVHYRSGDFPKSGSSPNGPIKHDMTFQIELTASAPARASLEIIEDPSSTAE